MGLKKALKEADDQCLVLSNEVQKAWKVAFTLQTDLKTESVLLAERQRFEKDTDAGNQTATELSKTNTHPNLQRFHQRKRKNYNQLADEKKSFHQLTSKS